MSVMYNGRHDMTQIFWQSISTVFRNNFLPLEFKNLQLLKISNSIANIEFSFYKSWKSGILPLLTKEFFLGPPNEGMLDEHWVTTSNAFESF